jgi:hypothetical protein
MNNFTLVLRAPAVSEYTRCPMRRLVSQNRQIRIRSRNSLLAHVSILGIQNRLGPSAARRIAGGKCHHGCLFAAEAFRYGVSGERRLSAISRYEIVRGAGHAGPGEGDAAAQSCREPASIPSPGSLPGNTRVRGSCRVTSISATVRRPGTSLLSPVGKVWNLCWPAPRRPGSKKWPQ